MSKVRILNQEIIEQVLDMRQVIEAVLELIWKGNRRLTRIFSLWQGCMWMIFRYDRYSTPGSYDLEAGIGLGERYGTWSRSRIIREVKP